MPEQTPKLGIKKPLGNETVSRAAFNENYDIIDQNAASQADLDAHLAESTQKHITESGSNANGEYIRFDDGTQICWGKIDVDMSILTDQTVDYPANFNVASDRIAGGYSLEGTLGSIIDAWVNSKGIVATGPSKWSVRIRSDESATAATVTLKLFAIGRWK